MENWRHDFNLGEFSLCLRIEIRGLEKKGAVADDAVIV